MVFYAAWKHLIRWIIANQRKKKNTHETKQNKSKQNEQTTFQRANKHFELQSKCIKRLHCANFLRVFHQFAWNALDVSIWNCAFCMHELRLAASQQHNTTVRKNSGVQIAFRKLSIHTFISEMSVDILWQCTFCIWIESQSPLSRSFPFWVECRRQRHLKWPGKISSSRNCTNACTMAVLCLLLL